MFLAITGALLLATVVGDATDNPRFVSPNGEMTVVIRRFPSVGDFESISTDEYFRRLETDRHFVEPLPEDPPPQPVPTRGALYRVWPGGHPERLAEFTCGRGEPCDNVLVADDGHFITYDAIRCDDRAELLTIRAADGSIARTLRVRDVMTANDQQWLCQGDENDVRFTLGHSLRLTMLVTDGRWDDRHARHHVVDVDLHTGAAAKPDRDLCPPAQRVRVEADDQLPRSRSAADVEVLRSTALLDRAIVRVLPQYPLVAAKARISGVVGAQVLVGTDGKVEAVSIVKPLPFGIDAAATAALQQWQFAPAPTRVSGVLAFRFEILRGPRLTTSH